MGSFVFALMLVFAVRVEAGSRVRSSADLEVEGQRARIELRDDGRMFVRTLDETGWPTQTARSVTTRYLSLFERFNRDDSEPIVELFVKSSRVFTITQKGEDDFRGTNSSLPGSARHE